MNEIFGAEGLPTLEGEKRKGGSDAAYVTEAGIPCIDSLGVEGHKIHSPDEFALISSLAESAKRIAAVAVNI
jgi:acetylornithine deacetylase/succinyl-diaminopimelate desuccinylase-like protein